MFNKNLLALCVASIGLGAAGLVQAIDGTIHFTGSISATSCSVSSVAGSATTAGSVNFGRVSTQTLDTAGKRTVATPFEIGLSDCELTKAPRVAFNGVPVTASLYDYLFTSNIPGVGIRISDAETDDNYIPGIPSANSGLAGLALPGTVNATARFNAYLMSYNDTSPMAGEIDTSITFNLDYE